MELLPCSWIPDQVRDDIATLYIDLPGIAQNKTANRIGCARSFTKNPSALEAELRQRFFR
jgi:hypothetical protein